MSGDWVDLLRANDVIEEVRPRPTGRQVRLVDKLGKDSHGRVRWQVIRIGAGRVQFTRLAEDTIRRFWQSVPDAPPATGGDGG